jgi:MFS family permease
MPRERLFTASFVLCSISNLLQGLGFNLFLHLPGFLDELGASKVMIGFLFGLASVVGVLVRPPIGRWMDIRGRRSVVLWGCLLNVGVCLGYLAVDRVGPLLVAIRVVHGVSAAMLFTALFTLAADWVPASRRTEGLALFGVTGILSISLGGVLGDLILERTNYVGLFQAALVFGMGAWLCALFLRDRLRSGSLDGPKPGGFAAALRQADLLPLWWIGAIFATALASIFGFLKLFVQDTGLGSVGGFFTAYAVAATVMRVAFGWVPDRVGPKRALFPSLVALAVGFAMLAGADSARDVIGAGVLCGLGHGYSFPILYGMVVTRASEEDRGSAMAIYTALFDAGVVVGGPLFGLVIAGEGYAAAYLGAACLLAVGTLVFAAWDRSR